MSSASDIYEQSSKILIEDNRQMLLKFFIIVVLLLIVIIILTAVAIRIYGKIKADSADMEEQNDFLFEFDTLSDSDRENSTDSATKLKIEDDLDIEFIDVVELETTLHEE